VGKGINEVRSSPSIRMHRALQRAKTERERSERAGEELYRRHQEIRKQSGLPDPAYYKELEKIYLANLSDEEHMLAVKELQQKYGLQEGWKSKLGAAALAGAAALSPAPASADAYDTVMEPIRKVQKFQRDIGNFGRNVERDVSSVRNKVGRDLESIPIGGIDQVGRVIRGSTNHQQLQRDPAWDARVQAAKEKQARDQAEREYRMQQDAERYDTGGQETSRDRGRWGSAGVNESSAGATGAGAIATGINSTNGGFGWSVFYKQPRKKKAKIK